jgi:VanZ family protein
MMELTQTFASGREAAFENVTFELAKAAVA